ncbi:MAG: hypothetical protein H6Q05_3928 [Acidobacteria bacterium]|nr:hypothetical protein [Acidobacteriota bacterium]
MATLLNRYRKCRFIPGAVLGAFVLLMALASPASAQSRQAGQGPEEWKFTLAPYFMLPWMNGTTAVRGHEVGVDVGPGDIFSNLQFGVMGYFEARKSRWAVGVDAIYMALGDTVDTPAANVDFNQGAYTFIGLRQLNKNVDFVFGARWNVLQGKLDFKGPVLLGAFDQTKQWVNPIVGLKVHQSLGGKWHFTMEGDIGGFGAGSDFAWHLFPVVGLDVGKRATLGIGYRVLSEDYKTGEGNQLFKYDVVTQAFVLGATFRF